MTSKTDRKNQTIQYVYDAMNRLTTKIYPDSTSANYIYDLVSKIRQVTDPTGVYGFAYDNMGRLIGTTTQYSFLPAYTFQNAYGYDAASNRTAMVAPDGSTNSYGYDTLNRLSTLTNSLTGQFGFSYDALSRRTQLTRPNGINTNYSYDAVSHLLSVLHQAGSTTLDGASYGYDYAGNRTSKTNDLNGITEGYSYDLIYELTQVTQGSSTTESYSYDAVGNRLSSLTVPSYTYNASNELTSNSSGSYTYDANGNTLSDAQGRSFTWDFENRLTQAVVPGTNGGTTTFKYDPFGRRIYKQSPSFTSIFVYDGPNLIETVNGSGAEVASYTQSSHDAEGPLLDEPLAELRSSTTSYYQPDGLGSITSLSSSSGTLANTYTYDSFGNTTASTGTVRNYFQYTARKFDPETGIYEYRARYFDPTTGRFLSEDPAGFRAGLNFYRYVRNQPVNFKDPSGLYQLQGFTPQGAAQMSIAIGQLAAKLNSNPCCIDPKLRDRILDLLQPFGSGGITFVYKETLPSDPGYITCAQVPNGWAFLTNKIEISAAAMNGQCGCPLPGTILHEATHLTWKNWFGPPNGGGAYAAGSACYGQNCAQPPGVTDR